MQATFSPRCGAGGAKLRTAAAPRPRPLAAARRLRAAPAPAAGREPSAPARLERAAAAAPAARLALLAFSGRAPQAAPRAPLALAAAALPSLDVLLDELALAYYAVIELAPAKKAAILLLSVAAAALYWLLRERVEKVWLEVKFVEEEVRRADPAAPKWWQGWHLDWNDALEGYLKPAWAARKAQRELRAALRRQQAEAMAARVAAEKELEERLRSGTWEGAEELKQYVESRAEGQHGAGGGAAAA